MQGGSSAASAPDVGVGAGLVELLRVAVPEGGQGQARAHQRIDPERRLITAGRGPSRQRALEAGQARSGRAACGWRRLVQSQRGTSCTSWPAHAGTRQHRPVVAGPQLRVLEMGTKLSCAMRGCRGPCVCGAVQPLVLLISFRAQKYPYEKPTTRSLRGLRSGPRLRGRRWARRAVEREGEREGRMGGGARPLLQHAFLQRVAPAHAVPELQRALLVRVRHQVCHARLPQRLRTCAPRLATKPGRASEPPR